MNTGEFGILFMALAITFALGFGVWSTGRSRKRQFEKGWEWSSDISE